MTVYEQMREHNLTYLLTYSLGGYRLIHSSKPTWSRRANVPRIVILTGCPFFVTASDSFIGYLAEMFNYRVSRLSLAPGPLPRGRGANPPSQKSLHKNSGSTFGCFGRLQSLIALNVRPLNMATCYGTLTITSLYLLSG